MSAEVPLALVGIGCKFPGGSDTKDLYYEFLRNKVRYRGSLRLSITKSLSSGGWYGSASPRSLEPRRMARYESDLLSLDHGLTPRSQGQRLSPANLCPPWVVSSRGLTSSILWNLVSARRKHNTSTHPSDSHSRLPTRYPLFHFYRTSPG